MGTDCFESDSKKRDGVIFALKNLSPDPGVSSARLVIRMTYASLAQRQVAGHHRRSQLRLLLIKRVKRQRQFGTIHLSLLRRQPSLASRLHLLLVQRVKRHGTE
jgi:hypothetical protein